MVKYGAVLLFSFICLLLPPLVPAPAEFAAVAAGGGGVASSGLVGLAGLAGLAGFAPLFLIKAAIKKKALLVTACVAGICPTKLGFWAALAKKKALFGLGGAKVAKKAKKARGKITTAKGEECEVTQEEVWKPQCSTVYQQVWLVEVFTGSNF